MSDNGSAASEETGNAPDNRKEELWEAFRSGFAAGREGEYYAKLPAIAQRAARTEFEQFYESTMRDE